MNQRQRDFAAGVEAAFVVADKHRSYFRSLDAARVVANEIRALEPPAEMADLCEMRWPVDGSEASLDHECGLPSVGTDYNGPYCNGRVCSLHANKLISTTSHVVLLDKVKP